MKRASLTVVGTGIKFLAQMTLESRTYIEKSDKVLYLLNDPALKEWVRDINKNSESLDDLYFSHTKRINSYKAITDHILTHLIENKHICVVMYGHPTVFSKPALDAVIEAKKQGYDAKILPVVSSEDCLFADLLVDPGTSGCQSFETTDFILYRRKFDPNSHLILWQPDVIGIQGHEVSQDKIGIRLLGEYLQDFYPSNHDVIVYEAAQYPGMKSKIVNVALGDLENIVLSPICTLYIKPFGKSKYDNEYAKRLNIEPP